MVGRLNKYLHLDRIVSFQARHREEVTRRADNVWKLIDRIMNVEIRSITKITDVTLKAAMLKWHWSGHIYRMSNNQ